MEPRWIPVSERLPVEGIRVLAHYDGKVFTAEWFEGIWHWIEANTFTPHVEHWMPLPEPPAITRDALREQWEKLHGK